jgi:hypothetical protein
MFGGVCVCWGVGGGGVGWGSRGGADSTVIAAEEV